MGENVRPGKELRWQDEYNWDTFARNWRLFLQSNGFEPAAAADAAERALAEQRKVITFLAHIGHSPLRLLEDLCSPDEPEAKTLPQLFALLKGHFAPAPKRIASRFAFYT